MKLPIIATAAHQGKALELDSEGETITLRGLNGEHLGTATWGAIVDYIWACENQDRNRYLRAEARAPLAVKVRYWAQESAKVESLTGGIGGGGLFIESATPLDVGTEIQMDFALPDRPLERLEAKGRVVWVRLKPERRLHFPGMGVEFTGISTEAHKRVVELVTALNRNRFQG
ncbi:MAG: PilZ domain-containing protein [Nitrospiraceae bacterium]